MRAPWIRGNGIRWISGSPEIRKAVETWLQDPDAFETLVLSQSPYRRVVAVSGATLTEPIAIKEFLPIRMRTSRFERIVGWLRWLTRRSASEREWHALERLSAAGVAVARPLAFARRRGGGALIVTQYVTHAKTLKAALEGYAFERHRLMRNVGKLVRRLHESGYLHGDLHIGNILIGNRGPVLVDLQRVHEIQHPDDRLRDLAFLDFSLHHLGVTLSDRLRFRIAALGHGPFRVAAERQMLRDIGRASSARGVEYFRGRTRRTLRTGEGFERIDHEGWSGLRMEDVPEANVLAAIAAHRREVASGGPDVIKSDHRAQISAVRVGDTRIIVKQVVKSSLRKRVADAVRGSAGRRAWIGGHGLQLRGIGAATPLAFLELRRHGVPLESIVLLEDLSDLPCAADVAADDPLALALPQCLLKLLLRLHRNEVIHGDLQALHIYLKRDHGVVGTALIDLEGVRFSRHLEDRDRIEMLAQLNASIGEDVIPTEARIRMMERYLRALPFEHGNERALRQVVQRSLKRDQRWKGPA